MTRAGRIALGLALGVLLAYLIHPNTSPTLRSGFSFSAPQALQANPLALGRMSELGQPTSQTARWQWVEVGVRRIMRRERVEPKDLDALIAVAQTGAKAEPENAYWLAAQALFARAAGRRAQALEAWKSASTKPEWEDPQTQVILELRQRLRDESGFRLAWQSAVLRPFRSDVIYQALVVFAREISRTHGLGSESDLRLRCQTSTLGSLIRDRARTVIEGEMGAMMVEIASYPPDVAPITSPRRLLIARGDFLSSLNHANLPALADVVGAAFRGNDGFSSIGNQGEADEEFHGLATFALIVATLPGGLLLAAISFALLWLGAVVVRKQSWEVLYTPGVVIPVGVCLAGVVYALCRLPIPAFAVAASFGFLAFSPKTERSKGKLDDSPQLSFVLTMVSLGLVASVALLLASRSAAGASLSATLGIPDEYSSGAVFLALASVFGGLALVLAPAWAFPRRIATHKVAAVIVETCMRISCLIAFGLVILGTLPAAIVELHVQRELGQVIENEPMHGLNR